MNMNVHIKKAIKVLNDGGIIMYPTDTAFGIGCRVDRPVAVDRLFRIRKRPLTQATPVLVSSSEMALPYFHTPSDVVRRLMDTYWPGALTIIYMCDSNLLHSPIRGSTDTVGLRMPDHQTALSIIRGVGVPILGPSANFHGDPTPYKQADLNSELIKLVDFVVSGQAGSGTAGPSTVVDCTSHPARVLRQGSIMLSPEEVQ